VIGSGIGMTKKIIDELDKSIKLHLERDDHNREKFNKERNDFWYDCLMTERISFSVLMEFCNKAIGRVEVNKLCRKYGIRNRY
jgi:hypothetical protein